MSQEGDVIVRANISFTGSVRMQLYSGMTVSEIIADIISDGDYEYEVIQGSYNIENVDDYDNSEDYTDY